MNNNERRYVLAAGAILSFVLAQRERSGFWERVLEFFVGVVTSPLFYLLVAVAAVAATMVFFRAAVTEKMVCYFLVGIFIGLFAMRR